MNESEREIRRIQQLYRTKYNPDPSDRTHIWHPLNPVALYFRQAQERAVAELFRQHTQSLHDMQILDLGCGQGGLLTFLVRSGASPYSIRGVDLLWERLVQGRTTLPASVGMINADGANLPFQHTFFDLVCQFTVFSSIFSPEIRSRVASEVNRILKPGGLVLWYDLRIGKTESILGIDKPEIKSLFPGYHWKSERKLHIPFSTRLAQKSSLLCGVLEHIPGIPRTHILGLLQKP